MASPNPAPISIPKRDTSPPRRPFTPIRRASTISALSTGSHGGIALTRKFSTSSIYSGGDLSPVDPPSKDDIEVLFQHSARVVSFTIHERDLKGKDVAEYVQSTERTLSTGPMKIYRVKFSTAFLQGGQLLQPLLPRSAGWCMDEARGIFVLRIRRDNYYRLELLEVEDDASQVKALKSVLADTIVFEKSNCPFRPEGQNESFEEPAPLPVFKRSKSVASRAHSRNRGLRRMVSLDSFNPPANGGNHSVSPKLGVPTIQPRMDSTPALPVLSAKSLFEDKPKPHVPRLQVPQYHPRSASPRSSPLRSRSVSPLAQEIPSDVAMIPENRPITAQDRKVLQVDDEVDSLLSARTVESPRLFPLAPSNSDSGTSTPIEIPSDAIGLPISRGRSPERKELKLSSLPTPVAVVVPQAASLPPPQKSPEIAQELSTEPPAVTREDPTKLNLKIDTTTCESRHATPRQSPIPSPPTTPPLLHSTTDSDDDEPVEVLTPESKRGNSFVTNGTPNPVQESPQVVIQNNDPDSLETDILPTSTDLPLSKPFLHEEHIQFTRQSRRFIRSTDHQAARGIFSKTINIAVHKPSNFLLRFMLRVADRILKGAKIYVYYWGDWRNGSVKGKGGRVDERKRGGSVDGRARYTGREEDHGVAVEDDEDDFGVKITGRRRVPYQRRDSI
ncbi:hypothetical protein TWF694_010855 [Orbilia ellipsospora]|uniref:Inheritance of peroxisomes protein 1 n=1 Tax=Orbilia ellipsospora TaxID=2528407 RepID=A0AAV9X8D7_9PEZI